MKKDISAKNAVQSRREAIKKIGMTSTFIVPTLLSFNVKELQACVPTGCSNTFSKFQWSGDRCWEGTFFSDWEPRNIDYWNKNYEHFCADRLSKFLNDDYDHICNLMHKHWKLW